MEITLMLQPASNVHKNWLTCDGPIPWMGRSVSLTVQWQSIIKKNVINL